LHLIGCASARSGKSQETDGSKPGNDQEFAMKDACFGLSAQLDTGHETDVAMNANGLLVEVHTSENASTLWCHVGRRNKATVDWSGSHQYADGFLPSCALNTLNKVVAVHRSATTTEMMALVGTVNGDTVQWHDSQPYDTGTGPRVALNDGGVVVEVHQSSSESKLWYHVGKLEGETLTWFPSHQYDTGKNPAVAINNQGLVVEVHQSSNHNDLWCTVGNVVGETIEWGSAIKYDSGMHPSVAITDSCCVIEVHESEHDVTTNANLWHRVGVIKDATIDWLEKGDYDNGERPSVACAGTCAVQTHASSDGTTLWFSTSLITDRCRWMQDNLPLLRGKSLRDLTLPASHDSGMYTKSLLASTQYKDLHDQLAYGIRYFDLRPGWYCGRLHIMHGGNMGPLFSDVLADIQRFMNEGHRELVILKFSHFQDIDDDRCDEMTDMICSALKPWLLPSSPSEQRLAEIPLDTLISERGVILAFCSGQAPLTRQRDGIWVYRNWDESSPEMGHLCVYDKYTDTTDYNEMKDGQLTKFAAYDGKCSQKPEIPCDLFLLSWTLTPVTHVWKSCKVANLNLGAEIAKLEVPNSLGFIPNILYVDYVESARVTDVAMFQNGLG
jgi:hypothetical protein